MAVLTMETYLRRAKDFFEAMGLLNEPEFANASALLAIHSVIANSDALRVGLGLQKLAGNDHTFAYDSLAKRLTNADYRDLSGLANLKYLLSMKSAVAYGPRRIDLKQTRKLTESAERFSRWVTRAGEQLNIDGCRYADQ